MLVRESSHHTVLDIGFDYLMKMIGHYRSAFGEKLLIIYALQILFSLNFAAV